MKAKKDTVEVLMKYVRGELSENENRQIEKQIKSDREIAELYALLKNLLKQGKRPNWTLIESSALKLSSRQFEDFRKSKRPNQPPYAITLFDSGLLPLPAGVRSSPVDTRRLKYKINEMELEMSFYPTSFESYDILGRISGSRYEGIRVILKSGKNVFSTEPDEFLVFRFERVPSASYSLQIMAKNKIIGVTDFQL